MMRILESLRVAISGLMANRMRSVLTMLGIIIGVTAVLALVSLGQAFQQFVNSQFQALGSNLVTVFPARPGGPNADLFKPQPLTLNDAQAIASPVYVSDVVAVAPIYNVQAKVLVGGNTLSMEANGVTPAWQDVRDWAVSEGRFIDETDLTNSARVAVVGTTTVTKLFEPGVDPVGQEIRINNIPFNVIGVLVTKGGFGNADQILIVPFTTAHTRLRVNASRTANGEYTVSNIYAKATSDKVMTSVQVQIQQLLFDRHKIEYPGAEDFRVVTQGQILNTVNNVTGLLTLFLGVIAGISLLVGGIGVMNIMLVSVTERTREIGLRKAVGARYLDLMLQFLVESVVLSLGGGMVGIALAALLASIASQLIRTISISITIPSILLAVGVSTAIGVFFGLYPASRAAALDPIEALRYE